MTFNTRKLKVGSNVIFTSLVCLVLLFMVNYVAKRHYKRFDLTSAKLFTLSDKTKKVLDDLSQEVNITVFFQPMHVVYKDVKTLLTSYESYSPKIKIEYVDPDKDTARFELLIKKYKLEALNTIIVESGNQKKYVSDMDLVEMDYPQNPYGGEQPKIKAFKGEAMFTSAVLMVTSGEPKWIYFVSGHGEKDYEIAAEDGLSFAQNFLERDNYKLKKITLVGVTQIPADAALVSIVGPQKEFTASELTLLDEYLQKGGKLLVAVDPLVETGLNSLLNKWGLNIEANIVVDPAKQLPFVSGANLYVDTYLDHPIAKNMQSVATLYFLARSVSEIEEGQHPDMTVSLIAQTTETGWGETDVDKKEFVFDVAKDKDGPVSIAAAVSGKSAEDARLVVFGDSDFISNAQIKNMGNSDMFLNSVNWLAVNEELISIGSKPKENTSLILSSAQMFQVFMWALIILPLLGIVSGFVSWMQRRA